MESEIPFDVMKEIVPHRTLRKMMEEGKFAGQIPEGFNIDSHTPRFAPKTNYGWALNSLDAVVRKQYRKFYNQRTQKFVYDFQAGKIQTPHDMDVQRWRWYMEYYPGTLFAVAQSVDSLLDYLDKKRLSGNTLVLCVGNQGFYLGEHGLYDKRLIFEESFRTLLIMRRKGRIAVGVRSNALVQNIDYAPTILDVTHTDTPTNRRSMEGISLKPLFKTEDSPTFRNKALYYAFYEQPGEHNAPPRHDGFRNERYTFARIWTPTGQERRSSKRRPAVNGSSSITKRLLPNSAMWPMSRNMPPPCGN